MQSYKEKFHNMENCKGESEKLISLFRKKREKHMASFFVVKI